MDKIIFWTLVFTVAQSSHAFTLISSNNPNQKGWADSEITLNVNTTNCPIDVVSLINDAAAVWNNVANSNIKVSYGASTSSTSVSNPTTIYCETNFNSVTGADEDYVPAAAGPSISNGIIVGGIMYLNISTGAANIANFDRNILTIVVAHEIGHVLGLGHSSDKNALMYFDGSYRNTLSLAQDDIDGISYLYPSNEFGSDKILGCGTVGRILPPPPPKALLGLVLLMFIPLVVAVRLRSRSTLI